MDGGHTYDIICATRAKSNIPENQFVEVRVFTGVPNGWTAEIAMGLIVTRLDVNLSTEIYQGGLSDPRFASVKAARPEALGDGLCSAPRNRCTLH